MSLSMMLIIGSGTIVAWLAGSCARLVYLRVKDQRDQVKIAHDALDAAGKRLEAARQANQKPIDPKKRNDFEKQP